MTPNLAAPIADGIPEPVQVPIDDRLWLPGTLSLPPHPVGVVLFAHAAVARDARPGTCSWRAVCSTPTSAG